jgi:uncharacterized protein YegP (UPF0339 family)
MHTMKTTHLGSGHYVISGYAKEDELVQYELTKTAKGWTATLIYGKGIKLGQLFTTKASAIQAITHQG